MNIPIEQAGTVSVSIYDVLDYAIKENIALGKAFEKSDGTLRGRLFLKIQGKECSIQNARIILELE